MRRMEKPTDIGALTMTDPSDQQEQNAVPRGLFQLHSKTLEST